MHKTAKMKQFKITSADFRLPGEDSTIPDCYIDPVQLAQVKKLSGLDQLGIMEKYNQRNQKAINNIVVTAHTTPMQPVTMMSKNK